MTLAATCPGCGVMGGCICAVTRPNGLPIPEEPARQGLPASPSGAYAQGWREGWLAAWQEAMKRKERSRRAKGFPGFYPAEPIEEGDDE